MKVTVLYFASLAEHVGVTQEDVLVPPGVKTIEQLQTHLGARGNQWKNICEKNIRTAANKTFCKPNYLIKNLDELAFFPPVTGG